MAHATTMGAGMGLTGCAQQSGGPILLQVNPGDCAHLERQEWRMRQHPKWQPEPALGLSLHAVLGARAHLPIL